MHNFKNSLNPSGSSWAINDLSHQLHGPQPSLWRLSSPVGPILGGRGGKGGHRKGAAIEACFGESWFQDILDDRGSPARPASGSRWPRIGDTKNVNEVVAKRTIRAASQAAKEVGQLA